jgi:hypothetical protein
MKLEDYISPINKCHHHQNKYKGILPLQLCLLAVSFKKTCLKILVVCPHSYAMPVLGKNMGRVAKHVKH